MIKFTSGSVFKVISLCKSGRRYSDDEISRMLFPNVQYTSDFIGHVKDCTKNLPDEVTEFMKNSDQEVIVNTLKEAVKAVFSTVISTEKQPYLIAALQKILEEDIFIADSAQIGYDPAFTKGTIKAATSVEPIAFISNILYCICNQQNNQEGKTGIKGLNKTYIDALDTKAATITLLTNTEFLPSLSEPIIMPAVTGDDYCILVETPQNTQVVNIYEKFSHSWRIKNTGIVAWTNRFLTLINKKDVRVKPTNESIPLPALVPTESATVTVEMDARYFEGTYTLIWDIQSIDGTSYFPNKANEISFNVTVKNDL